MAAYLKDTLIRPVDDARAARDIAMLAEAAKAQANVTPLHSRRQRAFKQVAAAAAVIVVASGAGFGAAQFGGTPSGDDSNLLAIDTPNEEPTSLTQPGDTGSPDVNANTNDAPNGDTAEPSPDTAAPSTPSTSQPSTPDTSSPSTSQPDNDVPDAPRAEAPVGDAGRSDTIEDGFSQNDTTEDDACDTDGNDVCDTSGRTDDEPVVDEPDPRDLLRERRFGAN